MIDKVLPSVKPEARPLPAGAPVDPQAILEALTTGSLSTEQAREIMGLLVDRARIAETLETAERLARIERLLSKS